MTNLNCSADATIKQSKLILGADVLRQRFGIVASLAEPLPVRLIPEQLAVATVRNDVVNYGGRCQLTLGFTRNAKRMRTKKRFTDSPPASVVDVVLYPSVVCLLSVSVVFTVSLPSLRQAGATGNGTWMARFIWHKNHLISRRWWRETHPRSGTLSALPAYR